jgi:hypothetical protein
LFLLVIENGAGTGNITLLIDPGFFVTHPTNPNESSITWCMDYYAGG